MRELRLLFGLLLVLFITSEVWRTAGRLEWPRLLAVVVGAVVVVAVLVGVGLRRALRDTLPPQLVSRAVYRVAGEVLSLGLLLCALLVVLGFVSVELAVVQEWSGEDVVRVLFEAHLLGQDFVLTQPLLQVATCLAALGSLVFAIEVLADAETRTALLHDLVDTHDSGPAKG